MSKFYKGYFEKVFACIVKECEKSSTMLDKFKTKIMIFSSTYSQIELPIVIAQTIVKRVKENPAFAGQLIQIYCDILTTESILYDLRLKLLNSEYEEGQELFNVLYSAL